MTATETRHSICDICDEPISITAIAGRTCWCDVTWTHTEGAYSPKGHAAVPEVRFVIDATCPGCNFPEIGFAPAREEFVCSRCGHTQETRPAA
jgi:ribosomal protein S27E